MTIWVNKVEETQSHGLKRLDNLKESTEGNQDIRIAEDTSNLKHIIYSALEIPKEDFPFEDIRPFRIGQLKPNEVRPLMFEAKTFVEKKRLLKWLGVNEKVQETLN